MAVFELAFAYIIANEGHVFTDYAADHGGATRYGISIGTLAEWRGGPVTPSDVEALTLEEAKAIYRGRYWKAVQGDLVASQPVATAMLDAAVVCGPRVAIHFAQELSGVEVDGVMGPVTLAAVQKLPPRTFLLGFMDLMTAHFLRVSQGLGQSVFLAGWLKRANRIASLIA